MRDELLGTANLSSRPSVLARSLFVNLDQPIDGQVEVSGKRGSGYSADSPSDCIARQIAVTVIAAAFLGEVRWIDVDLDTPADAVN